MGPQGLGGPDVPPGGGLGGWGGLITPSLPWLLSFLQPAIPPASPLHLPSSPSVHPPSSALSLCPPLSPQALPHSSFHPSFPHFGALGGTRLSLGSPCPPWVSLAWGTRWGCPSPPHLAPSCGLGPFPAAADVAASAAPCPHVPSATATPARGAALPAAAPCLGLVFSRSCPTDPLPVPGVRGARVPPVLPTAPLGSGWGGGRRGACVCSTRMRVEHARACAQYRGVCTRSGGAELVPGV